MNLYHVTKFSPYFPLTLHCFYTRIGSFMPVLSIRIVLNCFYLHTAISRKVVGKMCTRQSRKVTWGMINTLLLTMQLSNLLLLLSFSICKHTSMASRAIVSNFFEEQWTQNRPQYLSELSRALFPTTFLEIAVFSILRNSQLESDVCRLREKGDLKLSVYTHQTSCRRSG